MSKSEAISPSDFEIWSEDLTKVYGKGKERVRAVKGIDLRIESGVHGFLGPNGAGKTTTLNMLVGALHLTEGKAFIRGKKAGSVEAKEMIGFLPQDPVFYYKKTGEDYLIFMGKLNGLDHYDAKRKAQELIYEFDLWDARDRVIRKYSGGMRQKIGIAGVLIHDPKLLILDEPTANLDPLGRIEIINKIKEISKDVSVFVSSHILSEIEQMCERVTMISKGNIVATGSIEDIKHKFAGNVYILDTNKNEELFEAIRETDLVNKAWIDKEDRSIHILPNNVEKLQENLPKILINNKANLIKFYRPELSLQDIFMEIMADEPVEDD